MNQPERPSAPTWTVRRATLVDVPAVARLLGVPHPSSAHPMAGSSEQAMTSVTRLVLTHVALELGEFWVATDAHDQVLSAVVLLPAGDAGQERLRLALRLDLGLLLPMGPDPAFMDTVPDEHWLLLPAVSPPEPRDSPDPAPPEPAASDLMLAELLAYALSPVDVSGLPVLSLQTGSLSGALAGAGFVPLSGTDQSGAAALRPAVRSAVLA